MRYVAPALLLGFLVFPSWSHRPLKRQRPRQSTDGLALPLERAGTMSTPSPVGDDRAPQCAQPAAGPPALSLVPPANTAAPFQRTAVLDTGGTYTTQLIATSFRQLRSSVFGAHAREQYDKTVALTLELLTDREDAA